MFMNRISRTGTSHLPASVALFVWFCFTPLFGRAGFSQPNQHSDYVSVATRYGLLVSSLAQMGDENQVTLEPGQSRFDSGRAVLKQQSAASLELRLIRGAYAVFRAGGQREAVGIGDRFGREQYLVLAIREDRLFFQTGAGYGLVYRNNSGETVLELINRAHLPPDVLDLAPKPQ